MAPSRELLAKIAKLEAVERRWLWSVISSIILAAILIVLVLAHLDMGSIARNEPVRISATHFLLLLPATIIILISNLSVFIEYFAFELHVERAVVIKKRHLRRSEHAPEEDQRIEQ